MFLIILAACLGLISQPLMGQAITAKVIGTITETVLGRLGNASRAPIHLPGLNQMDFSANRNFRLFESHVVQFRAELFNFFNHVNLGTPGLDVTAPDTFGRITTSSQGAGAANDKRIIQFALKYRF